MPVIPVGKVEAGGFLGLAGFLLELANCRFVERPKSLNSNVEMPDVDLCVPFTSTSHAHSKKTKFGFVLSASFHVRRYRGKCI